MCDSSCVKKELILIDFTDEPNIKVPKEYKLKPNIVQQGLLSCLPALYGKSVDQHFILIVITDCVISWLCEITR